MSQEQAEAIQAKLIERLPHVVEEINNITFQIALMISQLPPGELLKRAYWEAARHHMGVQSETEVGEEGMVSLRMVDYVQSVVASVPPSESIHTDVTDQEWQALRSLVENLFTKLNDEFFVCQGALKRKELELSPDLEDFFAKAQIYWCNIRGQRYQVHNIPFLQDALLPHNEVMRELYGIGAQDFVNGLQKIQASQTFGIGELFEDMKTFQSDITKELENRVASGSPETASNSGSLVEDIVKEKGWSSRRDCIVARFSEMDLHDIETLTNLPKALLEDLSWTQGEDKDFFKEGEYRGWPLREWPINKRPFLKLNGRHYCFDNFSLFDNVYRVLQRIIIKKKPEYEVSWKDKQQEVSERVPIELFKKLLPTAQVFKSVHYRWHTGSVGDKNWCEADALLLYEDYLIIVEVRGGAFTHTSPTTDFNAHFASLRNLILKPAEQGRRFVSYLESDRSVKLYDRNHVEVGTISRDQFEHVAICAVTLDPFTEIASRTQHLKKLGLDLGPHPVWSISIDDLRVYTELFDNPLVFLHFVEERMKASKLDIVETEDELDHLGLYLKHNLYTQYIQEINASGPVRWNGYRVDIDHFFNQRITDPKVPCSLRQKMPDRLEEILAFLGSSHKSGRRQLASTLLNCSGDWRNKIARIIDEELVRQASSKKPQSFSLHGEPRITVFCWHTESGSPNHQDAVDHVRSVMLATNEPDRLLLQLSYKQRKLVGIEHDFLSLAAIPPKDLVKLKSRAETLTQQRLNKARLLPKGVGRNQLCPCGSGKKYKKCHGG
ncbi:MAG: preprotein translocase subunit SecA [Nitrospira sp.]|nr:preprotein translocase subunit SecA [Nitrospira sp.]